MQDVRGTSPDRKAERVLTISLLSNEELSLWIHSPKSETSGWEIRVRPDELRRALAEEAIIPFLD